MKRLRLAALVGGLALILPGAFLGTSAQAAPFGYTHLKPIQKRLISGQAAFELDPAAAAARASAPRKSAATAFATLEPCALHRGTNVKVNQNCLNVSDPDLQGRAQAQNETSISVDPNNPKHIVASYNDYRRGDGTCGTTYSLDGGHTWADSTTPNGFTRGTFNGKARQYWQASGDTSVSWDSRGNAYLSCQTFNRGSAVSQNPDQSSAFYVYRSTGSNGASWNFPGRPVVELSDSTGTQLLDKQLMTVDSHKTSPFRDRIYVTYTLFAPDGTAYIYAVHSNDYGETFSAPVLVSSDSPLCTNTFGIPTPQGKCNENQFSQPFTGKDGSLYVTWANFNNPASGGPHDDGDGGGGGDMKRGTSTAQDNRNQMLLAKSTDGGATFSAPVKVGDYYDLPDCATYQGGADPGRACVPEKGATAHSIFRATNYPSGSVNPMTGAVSVTYGSYINRHSKESNGCTPTGFSGSTGLNTYDGVKTVGACNNDILLSTSTDGGATFNGTTTDPRMMPTVTNAGPQEKSDQYFQWADYNANGKLVVSYRDRQYGSDELNGFDDESLSVGSGGSISVIRVTSSSMPPPTQFSGVFAGDYEGLSVSGSIAHPIWTDSRSTDIFLCAGTGTPTSPPRVCTGPGANFPKANDENAFTAAVPFSG